MYPDTYPGVIHVGLQTQPKGANMLDFITPLVGSALSYFGASKANEMSKKMAREQMKFQQKMSREAMMFGQASAQHQMDWQERMSNTSYQRAAQDLQAAGLNPILALNSGASSPGGSSMSPSSPGGASANQVNEIAGAVSTAIDIKRAQAELKNMQEQNQNLRSQNKVLSRQADLLETEDKTETYKALDMMYRSEVSEMESKNYKLEQARKWIETVSNPVSKFIQGRGNSIRRR